MRPFRPLPAVIAASSLVLASCATMSADQCAAADWSALGVRDGERGENLKQADKREEACAKAGVAMDRTAYLAGRGQGLATYCTPQNGFEVGKVNGRYDGACADHNEPAFVRAHEQGMALASYKAAVATAQSRMGDAAGEIADISAQIDGYASGAIEFEAENHNEKVLNMWARRNYLQNVALPYWRNAVREGERVIDRYDQRGVYGGFDPAELAASAPSGPPPYTGPTEQDAREMVAEVFSSAAARARQSGQ